MNNIYQHYIIDLSSNNNFVQIPTVQGDGNNIRGFEVELIENGVQYEIDKNDCLVAIMGTKPDTSQIMNDCTVSDKGYILVDITSQMSAVKGRGDYQIVLMSRSTNSQLKSFPFHILTAPAAFDIDYIVSSDEFQTLTRNIVRTEEVIVEANDAISDVRALESSVSKAESIRISNENTRIQNETDRKQAEKNRIDAENKRITAENARIESEQNRADAENIRISNEETRKTNETVRNNNETNRIKSETDRINAEADRTSAEEDRITSENTRKSNEDVRKANESIRETNESNRQTNTATAISNAEKATDNANAAAEKAKIAGEKATAAETTAIEKATEAGNYAKMAQSYAVGTGDVRPDESTDNAKYYSEQSKSYADSWKGSLLPKGTITFSQLPTSDNVAGHMYNISDAFETDSRFKDGAGYAYAAGTNVYWTADEKWDCLSGAITMELTMAEYNALSDAQKMNGTIYYISDADNSIPSATENFDGLMSHADKQKLDGIEDGANAYSLPLASESVRGGVKIGYTQNGNNYPVQLNSDEQMYVNVPWTETNTQTLTGVKGSAESTYRTGNVNLTPANIGAARNSGYDCYGECTTAATTTAKTVTVNGNFFLTTGCRIYVKFDHDHLISIDTHFTLNVNSTGAKTLYGLRHINSNRVYEIYYNGKSWNLMYPENNLLSTDYESSGLFIELTPRVPGMTYMSNTAKSDWDCERYIVASGCRNQVSPCAKNGGYLYYNGSEISPGISLGGNSVGCSWENLYTVKAPVIVSDAKMKKYVSTLDNNYIRLFDNINIHKYVLNTDIGDTPTTTQNRRYHLGVIAQEVEDTVRALNMTSDDFGGVCSEFFACYGSFRASIHGGWRTPRYDREYSDNVYNWKHRHDAVAEPYVIYNEIMEEDISKLSIDIYRKNIGYIMIEDNSKLTKDQPPITVNSISLIDFNGNITTLSFTDFLRYYSVDDIDFENPLSDVTINENGSATISFDRMYGCAWLKLSETIDISKYHSVIIDMDYIGEYTMVFIPDGEYQNANPYDRDRNDQILYNYSFRYDELFNLTAYTLQETRKEFHAYKQETQRTIECLTEKVNMLLGKVGK